MLKFFKDLFKKENPVGFAMMFALGYNAPKRDLEAFAKEGYKQNPIVYRCINEIAMSAACIPLQVQRTKPGEDGEIEKLPDHPLQALLDRPNPTQSRSKLVKALMTDYLYSGNGYVTKVGPKGGAPRELWLLNPQKVNVKPGNTGMPSAFVYEDIGGKKQFDVDPITGMSDVVQWKDPDPTNYWYGLSKLDPAAYATDIHNLGLKFNKALLDNGGRPSGALVAEGTVTDDTYARLQEWKRKAFQGVQNAGEIPILDNGLKWQEMGVNPKDMDFANLMDKMSMYIASIFGVPFPLVIPEAATYDNMRDAREALIENTVLPLLSDLCETLTMWLAPVYGEDIKIVPDVDNISALEAKRERKFDRATDAINKGMMTINEARRMVGLEEIEGGDVLLVPGGLIPLELAGIGGADPQLDEQPVQDVEKALRGVGYSKEQVDNILRGDFGQRKGA